MSSVYNFVIRFLDRQLVDVRRGSVGTLCHRPRRTSKVVVVSPPRDRWLVLSGAII